MFNTDNRSQLNKKIIKNHELCNYLAIMNSLLFFQYYVNTMGTMSVKILHYLYIKPVINKMILEKNAYTVSFKMVELI